MLNNVKLPNFIGNFKNLTDSAKPQNNPNNQNPFQYSNKVRLSVTLAVIGILLFMAVSLIFPFRDQIFERLFPKPKSQAALCTGTTPLSSEKNGFVYTGGDLGQAISALNTSLYYSYDNTLADKRSVYMIGKYTQNMADPLNLRLLMDNGLSNTDFKGLWGQIPTGWSSLAAGKSGIVAIETAQENILFGKTNLKIVNDKSPSGTQVFQVFKKDVAEGQFIIFGAWVRSNDPAGVSLVIQNSQAPFQEIASADNNFKSNEWTFILDYGKVPADVSNFRLVMRVGGNGNKAWFEQPVAAIVNTSAKNQTLSDMVLQRCGSAWIIDNEPGWDQTYSSPVMKALPSDIYALIYQQFYTLIKNSDPDAVVLPGSLGGAPIPFDKNSTEYSPKLFLDNFRTSYKNFFGSEPPVDALGIGFVASDIDSWTDNKNLSNYMKAFRSYINSIPEWQNKPIWITKLGVGQGAPNEGVDFVKSALKFLENNNFNIAKWFWFDTCSLKSQVIPLFTSNNRICSWPMKLSSLGEAYHTIIQSMMLTSTPIPSTIPTNTVLSPTQAASAAATIAPTETPTIQPAATDTPTPEPTTAAIPTATPIATDSATPGT